MAEDWTVEVDMKKLNVVLTKFAEKKKKDLGELIAWASLGMVSELADLTPVRYGQARAGWIPFLWANHMDITMQHASEVAHQTAQIAKRQQKGLKSCHYKYKFEKTEEPYATVTNAVKHIVYLEYGVRKGKSKAVKLGEARLYSISKQMGKGFVKKTVQRWHKEIKKKLAS